MMRRRWMLTGVWALSTLAATLVAWGAVRLVTDQVSPAVGSPLPTAVALADLGDAASDPGTPRAANPTGRPAPRATGATGAPRQPAPPPRTQTRPPQDDPAVAKPDPELEPEPEPDPRPDPEPAAEPVTQAYELVGGVVTVRYQGNSATLVEASPSSGFVVEVNDGGPEKVDVRFRSDEHESRLVTRVRGGEPDPQRDERPR